MHNAPTRLTKIGHVELRVRDLDETATFYGVMFGLERRPAIPPNCKMCVCTGTLTSGDEAFSLVLTEGLPLGAEIAGLDHVSFTVPSGQDIQELHARAVGMGVRCTTPRVFDGNFQMFVFDPNGYKIELVASNGGICRHSAEPPERRGRREASGIHGTDGH